SVRMSLEVSPSLPVMDLFNEAVDYLQVYNIAPVSEDDVDSYLRDVFPEASEWTSNSPLLNEPCLPCALRADNQEDLLEKRLQVLKGVLLCEEVYLMELETLLTPMKALKAAAGTSQPVLSTEQVQTVFYQIPEIRDLHKDFYRSLQRSLEPEHTDGGEEATVVLPYHVTVGDAFLKFVNQLGVYRGFIDNYESAVKIVQECTRSDQRFRTLAESMSSKGADNDLWKHTPPDHPDRIKLQESLRLSSSFLSGVNERSQCKQPVMLSKGERRQLIRDGFVVDVCENGHNLRHLFLYTDMLLCAKLTSAGRQAHYRFCWYLPLVGLKLTWTSEPLPSSESQTKMNKTRGKMFQLNQALQQHGKGGKSSVSRAVDRLRRKLEECEIWLLTNTPSFTLNLHSTSGKSHTIRMLSLYNLTEWKEAIERQCVDCIETVPPDLLSVTSSCIKLRMTQQPPLHNVESVESAPICGSLYVMVQAACGLQQPCSAYVCVEVDGFEFYNRRKQTSVSAFGFLPQWNEARPLDGAQQLFLVLVSQEETDSRNDIVGRVVLNLDPDEMFKKRKNFTCSLGQVEVTLSIKYMPHPLELPSISPLLQEPVFGVPIAQVAIQERVLVPHIVRSCVEEVEQRGLKEEGIYRISGASTEIQALKHAFNSNYREAVSKLRKVDVNAVSGTLKLYFRELPSPLIPSELYNDFLDARDIPDPYVRADSLLRLLQSLPDVNRNTLLFLFHHLRRVAERKQENKMSLSNLATVFGPSLLRPPVARVDISQEVEVQVQVIYLYLQCKNLPEPILTKSLTADDTES
ncbi:hypothetical protein DNTS_017173, partial [Danionella cerebrum]